MRLQNNKGAYVATKTKRKTAPKFKGGSKKKYSDQRSESFMRMKALGSVFFDAAKKMKMNDYEICTTVVAIREYIKDLNPKAHYLL